MLKTCIVSYLGDADYSATSVRAMLRQEYLKALGKRTAVLFVDEKYFADVAAKIAPSITCISTNLSSKLPLWAHFERVEAMLNHATGDFSAEFLLLSCSKIDLINEARGIIAADVYAWIDFDFVFKLSNPELDLTKVYYPSKITYGVLETPLDEHIDYRKTISHEIAVSSFFMGDVGAIAQYGEIHNETFRRLVDDDVVPTFKTIIVQNLLLNPNLFFLLKIQNRFILTSITNAPFPSKRVFGFVMVKNEVGVIERTIRSLANFVDGLYIFDTGSTDDTIKVCSALCLELGIVLFLKEGVFIDFSTSRNEGLDFCDATLTMNDYLLLLDAGDELVNGHMLKPSVLNLNVDALYLDVELENIHKMIFNSVRLIRAKSGWRYKGRVHELIQHPSRTIVKLSHVPFSIFQNRRECAMSTLKRFDGDIANLKLDLAEARNDEDKYRAMFYLGNTYLDMGNPTEARKYYAERLVYKKWEGERFWAQYRIAHIDAVENFENYDEVLIGFFKCLAIEWRAEALLEIAKNYARRSLFVMADYFARAACEVELPAFCIFVETYCYDYERWHYATAFSFEVGDFERCLLMCETAITNGRAKGYDVSNDELNLQAIRAKLS